MALDLFQRTGLEQDTGILSERWGQEGSDLISPFGSFDLIGSGFETIYTVTTGKIFYVKTIHFLIETAGAITISDSDHVTKLQIKTPATTQSQVLELVTPLAFTTQVDIGYNAQKMSITFVGWEENVS